MESSEGNSLFSVKIFT